MNQFSRIVLIMPSTKFWIRAFCSFCTGTVTEVYIVWWLNPKIIFSLSFQICPIAPELFKVSRYYIQQSCGLNERPLLASVGPEAGFFRGPSKICIPERQFLNFMVCWLQWSPFTSNGRVTRFKCTFCMDLSTCSIVSRLSW